MKTKITYLLFLLPFLTFAQGPWNFNTTGDTEGFTCNSSAGALGPHTVTQNGTSLKIDFLTLVAGTTTISGNNPIIRKSAGGMNADDGSVNFIEIRLKNLSAISYLRLAPSGTTSNYGSIQITTADADYKTYVIDVSAWTGASVGIDILCKTYSGTTAGSAYVPKDGDYILIDYIKPLANAVTPEVNTYNFTSTDEGFNKLTRASAVPATESGNGTLQIKYVSGTNNALAAVVQLNSIIAHVEGANKYAHVTLKNTTTNTEFIMKGKVSGVDTAFSPIQTYTTGDAAYKTYDFDLTTWDNGYQFPILNFAVKNTWSSTATYAIGDIVISGNSYYKNLTGANSVSPAVPSTDTANWVICDATGAEAPAAGAIVGSILDMTNSVYIDSIVFDNNAPLGTTNFGFVNNKISLYPNPAHEVLNVNSLNQIAKIEVYDMVGKKVASNNNAKNVNVAALEKGVYIIKVVQENGSVVAKQFIKE